MDQRKTRTASLQGSKLRRAILASFSLSILFIALPAVAAEYFVNKQGNDANNGGSRQAAFLTIQKGVDALQAGDTLTIGPGEYPENVKRDGLGSADVDTMIRAEIPGTALLRGDVPAPEFKKVDGYRFIYAAPFDQKPEAVLEHNSMHTMLPKANVAELEFDPGFFHYDEASKTLYISNKDLSAPDTCRYTIAVSGTSGLILHNATRVTIDGLAAAGFFPGWGILLGKPVSCTVRNCVGFMNVGGIVLEPIEGLGKGDGGSDNVIEKCVCYGNSFGGIVRYGANRDVVRDCYLYKNAREGQEHFGVMHYSGMTGPLLFKDNIAWGHNFNYSVKSGNQQERLENCVGLGYIRIATNKMSHNLIGGGNEYDRGSNAPTDTVLFVREKDLDQDFEYADPLNLDFRLQPDSRFRGTAPDGSDRGPYQYKPNIFYVSPEGDDGADGLSMRKPWRSLARALQGRRPGDTVYLTPGRYTAAPLNGADGGEAPIKILGRGRGTVVVSGTQNITRGAGLVLERLNFANGVALRDCRDVTFKNCRFFGGGTGVSARGVENLKVTHCLFYGVPVNARDSSGVFLSGNLYANGGDPAVHLDTDAAVRYSDYNNYQGARRCWAVNRTIRSLDAVQKRHDRYSKATTPQLAMADGVPRVADDIPFKSTGPGSTSVGIYQEYDVTPKTMDLVGPFVHSTSATTANIEWWSSLPGRYSLAWGETPETKNAVNGFTGVGRFNTFSLTDLKPGQTYYFKIVSAGPSNWRSSVAAVKPEDATVSFKTPAAAAAPRTYYVAGNGKDSNNGLSREKAFRTLCRAAAEVGPGDTVLIADGEYNETVRIRAAGTKERPITFRCVKGEKAIHKGEELPRAVELIAKPDNRFDGIYFRGQSFWREGFVVRESPRVRITRCLNTMVSASNSPEMLVKNCVLHGGWTALSLSRCADSVVENNVFIMTILRHLTSGGGAITARRNVFCECIRNKAHQQLLGLSKDDIETDNVFYVRWPADDKLVINNLPLPMWRAQTGSNAIIANPMMPGTAGWGQGWQKSKSDDFDMFFCTNPELIVRDIGLQPEAFADFELTVEEWPYDAAWAARILEAAGSADKLAEEGRNAEALVAYTAISQKFAMSDRLKTDVLEKASRCAERMKNYAQALKLAEDMPVAPLSILRQMEILAAQDKYDEILKKVGRRSFALSYTYPELEDVMADLYYYRAQAYIRADDLEKAEADLKEMNDKRRRLTYRSGEAIHDLTYFRLGNFYRDQLKDEDRALESYLEVCDRTTWAPWGRADNPPKKTVLTGDDETLVKATEAACAILRKRGNLAKVKELQESLAKAQAEAAAAVRK